MKAFTRVFLGVLVLLGIGRCISETSTPVASVDSSAVARDLAKAVAPVDSNKIRAKLGAIDSVKKRFRFHKDSIYEGGYYEPRGQSGSGTTLVCYVSDHGQLDFRSVYVGDDWVFHEQIVARVGDQVIETAIVPRFDKDNYSDVLSGGGVFESVTFNGTRSGGLPQAIAQSVGETVKVRLVGRQRERDFTLSMAARDRIRDCVRLSSLLGPGT